jgi:hypothetical protein
MVWRDPKVVRESVFAQDDGRISTWTETEVILRIIHWVTTKRTAKTLERKECFEIGS